MDWWVFLKIFWTALAVLILAVTPIILWRIRGILTWKRSLKDELAALQRTAEQASSSRLAAVQIIERRCTEVLRSFSPEFSELGDLPEYLRSIAACYHPDSDRPELQVTIGPFLQSIEKSLDRFDRILQRPGFKKIRSVRIHNIRRARQWYLRISEFGPYQWYVRHQKKIRRISRVRLLIFPDPFTWLAYLSHHLTLLMLAKFLILDLYLFFGKLAVDAYEGATATNGDESEDALEKALEELDALEAREEFIMDPRIRDIRNRLVGLSSVLTSDPTFGAWKDSIYEAAGIVAEKHFPDSEAPLEEAAIGPLLERTRCWIGKLSRGEEYPLIRHFYQMRLDSLFRVKNLSDVVLPRPLRHFIEKTRRTYGWLKWPLKVYRLTRKTSPWRIALAVGWGVTKKAGVSYIYGKTFDTACRELENVYGQSRQLGEKRFQ